MDRYPKCIAHDVCASAESGRLRLSLLCGRSDGGRRAGYGSDCGSPSSGFGRVALAEAIDTASRIVELHGARVERVTLGANVDLEIAFRRTSDEGIAACAGHARGGIVGVSAVFHGGRAS